MRGSYWGRHSENEVKESGRRASYAYDSAV